MKHICYKHDHVEKKRSWDIDFCERNKTFLVYLLAGKSSLLCFLESKEDQLLYINKANSKYSYLFFMQGYKSIFVFICDLFGIYLLESF